MTVHLAYGFLAAPLVLAVPSAARADETIAELSRPSLVSAYDGQLAWSRYDAAAGNYRLVVRSDGRIEDVPVRPREEPFDVDLGPGPDGGVVAAYSRCAEERRGCDLYVYDFASRTERRLRRASTGTASEFLPTVWRDRVAFVRVYEGREGRRGELPYLYARRLDSSAASERLPGGRRGRTGRPGPTRLDLYGRRLGFTWTSRTDGRRVSVLRMDTIGRGHRLIDEVTSGALSIASYLGPPFDRGRLYAAHARRQAAGDRFVRYRLANGDLDLAVGRDNLGSTTADDGRFFYLRTAGGYENRCRPIDGPNAPCLLRATDRIDFD